MFGSLRAEPRSSAVVVCTSLSLLCLVAVPSAAQSSGAQWVETWGASPQQPDDPVFGPPNPPVLDNQTIREVARISVGGNLVRLRLTNEYTNGQTFVGSVHIARSAATKGSPSSAIVPGSDHVVTFGGSTRITLAPNAPALSDPIDFPVPSLSSLAVSIYVAKGSKPTTPHSLGQQTAYEISGDGTGRPSFSGAKTTQARYLLSGIDVSVGRPSGTIVTFGDSITDGYASTPDANARWPDNLAKRLQATSGFEDLAVANEGISGNRVRLEGTGPNAQSRFDRDVLSRPGLRYVTVLEGINDIGFPAIAGLKTGPTPTPEDIIQVYQELIQRAHEKGVRIFGCTLTPFKGAGYFTPHGEQTREAVNVWIRTSGQFDGLVDFDAAIRDPSNPKQMRPAYDSGDHLHPNDAGYRAMADSIDLRLFRMSPYLSAAARD